MKATLVAFTNPLLHWVCSIQIQHEYVHKLAQNRDTNMKHEAPQKRNGNIQFLCVFVWVFQILANLVESPKGISSLSSLVSFHIIQHFLQSRLLAVGTSTLASRGQIFKHWFTKHFRYLKWRVSWTLCLAIFGVFFPYISRIHTAYMGEDFSILGTWNVWCPINMAA